MRKIFFILITIFIFSSCTEYNSEIVYRVERPEGVIRDTISFVTFNSTCRVTYYDEKFELMLIDKPNYRCVTTSKYPIVIESFKKVKIN